jgi:beta-lactamase class A
MSSVERGRIATKGGWFKAAKEAKDGRNEAGVIFDPAGRPALTYALFAHAPFVRSNAARQRADRDNFAATHPALQARATMGREWLNAVNEILADASAGRSDAEPGRTAIPVDLPRSTGNGG